MSSGRSVTLNTGHQMPQLGYGTWQAEPGEVAAGVLEALRTGYRHLDLAKVYGNQAEVAIGLRRGLAEIPGLDRGQLFITSKLWNTKHRPADVEAALDDTLAELQLDYLDLYLIHWPVAFRPGDETHPTTTGNPDKIDLDRSVSVCQTWKAIIQLPKSKLEAVIQDSGVVPAVNQIERHPRLPNTALLDYCIAKKSSPLPIRPLATTALACRCSSPTPKSRLKPPGSPSRPPSLSSLGVSRAATPSSPSPSPLTASARTSRMSPSTALPSLPLPGSVRSLSASTCPASMRPFGTSTSSTRTWKSPPPTRSSSSSRHTWPWMTLDTA